MATIPTIILVPGAWHTPVHYALLIRLLKTAGYEVLSQQLPSAGSSDPTHQSVANDAEFIRSKLITQLIDSKKEVVLIMHSYGGCPGSVAAKSLSKVERTTAGEKGGIIGLIYIAALVAPEGASLKGSLPGQQYDPWVMLNPDEKGNIGQTSVSDPENVFYNDVNPSDTKEAIAALQFQSEASLSSPSPSPAWPDAVFNGKRAYIQTTKDQTIPLVAQEAMVNYSGVEWDVSQFDTGHSPFLSQPQKLADKIISLVKKYD